MNPSTSINQGASKKSFLKRAFPVPRSLILSNTAVDITDGSLKFFELNRARSEVKIKSYGTAPFPAAHIGMMSEKSRSEAVNALKQWSASKKCTAVNGVIHEGDAYVFRVTVATTNRSEMRAAIEALLEENVPIHPSEAVLEYSIVSRDIANQTSIVAVSVLSKKVLADYFDLFDQAGIKVVSVDTESRSLARSLFRKNDAGVHAVISIADHHTVLFIVDRGAVVFSSSVEVGSVDLDKAISKELGISEAEAHKIKKEKAFNEGENDMKIFEAMMPIFSIIQEELGKMLVYWRNQTKKGQEVRLVEDIVFSGIDTMISGFSRYITITSKIPTRQGSVWTNVLSIDESVPDIMLEESYRYGTVIGNLL
jgi:Tfp pilus assembly PilM family ATPase